MKTIVELLNALGKGNKKKFLIQKDSVIAYTTLYEEVLKAICLLQKYGFRKNDKLILSCANDEDIIVFFIAGLRCGITCILIDPETKQTRITAIINSAQPAGFIIDAVLKEAWQPGDDAVCILISRPSEKKGKLFQKLLNKKQDDESFSTYYPQNTQQFNTEEMTMPAAVEPGTIAYIIYTSGTTSEQKGVMISHYNLFTHLQTLSNAYQLNDQSVILNTLSLYHTDGIIQGPVLTLFNEATLCRKERFDVTHIADLLSCIYKYDISHFFVVPAMLSMINKFSYDYEDSFQTEKFRYVISSAATLEEPLWKDFQIKFSTRIINVYGLSETVAGGLFCIPDTPYFRMGTIGKPMDCEARILDEQGNECKTNEPGELVLKGENVFCGYLNNAAATNEVIKKGWFYTGDIAQVDKDGFYKITGRKKTMIKSGGFSIHPEEITEILFRHPAIFEAYTIGISDAVYGEKIISFIVAKENTTINVQELTDYCNAHLEPEKIPARFIFLKQIPKTPSGKTDVQKLISSVTADKIAINLQDELQNNIKLIAGEIFRTNPDAITLQSNASNVSGWDSLSFMNLITTIEESYSVNFITEEIMSVKKIEDILKILEEKI